MAILEVLTIPNPRLRDKAEEVTKFDQELKQICDDMVETMYHAGGIGLAAIQVGIKKRIFTMDVTQDKNGNKGETYIIINPEIIETSEEYSTCTEGCLSIPGAYTEVKRPAKVTINYRDPEGNQHTLNADGLMATCIQHEIDHLDGKLFLDYVSPAKRRIIMKKILESKK